MIAFRKVHVHNNNVTLTSLTDLDKVAISLKVFLLVLVVRPAAFGAFLSFLDEDELFTARNTIGTVR